jgi:hypothetical protein
VFGIQLKSRSFEGFKRIKEERGEWRKERE